MEVAAEVDRQLGDHCRYSWDLCPLSALRSQACAAQRGNRFTRRQCSRGEGMKPVMFKPVKVNPGHVLRYSFPERLIHWAAALSYIYLMLSGLAFWTPWMWWLAM